MTDTDRRAFKPFNDADNLLAAVYGKEVYVALRNQFADTDDRSRDLILNSMCYALSCLILNTVPNDNRPIILQIIHKILSQNVLNK